MPGIAPLSTEELLRDKDNFALVMLLKKKTSHDLSDALTDEIFQQLIVKNRFTAVNFHKLGTTFIQTLMLVGSFIDVWWSFVAYSGIAPAILAPLSVTFAVLTLMVGVVYSIYSYNKQTKQVENLMDFHQLIEIKHKIADEFLRRHGRGMYPIEASSIPNISHLSLVEQSQIVAGVFFFTFICGVSDIFFYSNSLIVYTALVGPYGLALGIVIALALGVYAGYIFYNTNRTEKEIHAFEETSCQALTAKEAACHHIQDEIFYNQGGPGGYQPKFFQRTPAANQNVYAAVNLPLEA